MSVCFQENAGKIAVFLWKMALKNDKMSKNVYFCWVITFVNYLKNDNCEKVLMLKTRCENIK